MNVLLKAHNLSHQLGSGNRSTLVLQNLSLQVNKGEKVAILGPSGCGKSTLLAVLGLLEKPKGGEIWLKGQPLAQVSEVARSVVRSQSIGFIFQFHFLLENFSILENLLLAMHAYRHIPHEEMKKRALVLLKEVELEAYADRKPSELSGGQQQRVAVARALMHDPDLLLADEPTGNLDPISAAKVFQLISFLAEKRGQGVILVTHNHTIAAHCDRVLELTNGALVEKRLRSAEPIYDWV